MGRWIESDWIPRYPRLDMLTFWVPNACLEEDVLKEFSRELPQDFRFAGFEQINCAVLARLNSYDHESQVTYRTGAFVLRFESAARSVEALVMGAHYADMSWYQVSLACIPRDFLPVWTAFASECLRLSHALEPSNMVYIVGGNSNSFVPVVDWGDIVLPAGLKDDLMEDVRSFFHKGIDIYRRLNLKPFRKLLLAGVPGTGKTMICNALAKWALAEGYVVIYVSSAQRRQGDPYGSTFAKIEEALSVAAYSQHPALILLEELDAYLHPEEKALVLNVLDGSESSINDRGTLLVATTNYPEAIDERVLKRPGRLDRIFIIPETRRHDDAEKMLRQYLGTVWHDDHAALVPELIGYPGAFIREVAVYALTQMAYDDLTALPYSLLERSYRSLKAQIEARDDFLKQRVEDGSNGHQ